MTEVVVIGCGVVGLGFAVALASRGVQVLGIDSNASHVRGLNAGVAGIDDAGLGAALRGALAGGTIAFATSVIPAQRPRAWVLCVPTPVDDDKRLDERFIEAALGTVFLTAHADDLVIVRSTVPVGHTRKQAVRLQKRGLRFVACPDRSVAGRAFEDQLSSAHIVGGMDDAASRAAAAVLAPLGTVITVSSPEAAEALKLFTNVWRDARFALANEMASFCASAGLDFDEIRAAGRTGFDRFDIPRAGPVGGPCLTKDVYLLAQSAEAAGADVPLLLAARQVNDELAYRWIGDIVAEARAHSPRVAIAVLGLAFKGVPQTRDRRGSFGVALLERLRAALPEADVRSWDPAENAPDDDGVGAVSGASFVVLANDHPALRDPRRLERCAPGAVVFDICGVLAGEMRADLQIRRLGGGRSGPASDACVA